MKRTLINTITLSSSILLVACGGGGSGDGATQDSNPPTSTSPTVLIGSIIDSPIQNIQFKTSSNREGTTDNNGEFEFEENDTVVFSIGNIEFEAIDAKQGLTPLELFGTGNLEDRRVINFTRFIQTLDDDGDISLAITITERAASAVETSSLVLSDFDSEPADFSASEKVQNLLTELNLSELVSIDNANTHFSESLRSSDIIDTDDDGSPNKNDTDDDNDGIEDQHDEHPYDEQASGDFDGDGIDNIDDNDDDNDGTDDSADDFPFDGSETTDSDGDSIGDNADTDDDNDGFSDDIDEFPYDPDKSGDVDGDGIDNLSDDDDDGDGVLDINDQFPLDGSETEDFDSDGIGDNADTDDDNDNIIDSEDRLYVTGQRDSYLQEETIKLTAKGFDPNFEIALESDGWHIQFYTYSVEEPGNYLTEYVNGGAYNANFDAFSKLWTIEYWAPRKPGNYRTELSLYCSMSPSACESFPYEEVKQNIFFASTCEQEPCTYEPLPARGNYVTNTATSSVQPGFAQKNDGSLIAIYSVNSEFSTLSTESLDGGATWEDKATLPERVYGDPSIIETAGGSLIFAALCNGGGGVCLYSSSDGSLWSKQDISPLLNFERCTTSECTEEITADSIIQLSNGSYAISYSHRLEEGNEIKYDVFVSSSEDLQNWSSPVQVSNGPGWEYSSSLLQTETGKFYIAYRSNDSQTTTVAASDDLADWSQRFTLGSYNYGSNPTLVEISGKPTVFYARNFNLYYSYLMSSGTFSDPSIVADQIPFGPDVKLLQNGKLGIIYEMDLNNQRDIFYEELDAPPVDG
ncbi:exo-alpha-sialidase [Microbulbifer flavimaris]|uniref:Exo-alpha-sialidase n=1 Tax=Microbulbifer flavimaris TaxID=1781068 RepID=A0ABX4HZQ6_9GAMM|nr:MULTISPECIES: sialidase family protein [Microbulbifer]KUJ83453.1 hypothetical protein AVO43_06200 [Microbulbifer sp. ZGT114]PCO05609.1 exo-alpha-sialidase [Microbulbifer flavimaris]